MNIRTQVIALGIKILADKNIIARPDYITDLFATFTTGQSYEMRTALAVENMISAGTKTAAKVNTNRKFKKIVENV